MLIYLQLLETEEEKNKFEQLYEMYYEVLYGAAFKVLKNQAESEDAVHETFMAMMDYLQKIHVINSRKTRALIVTILKNKVNDVFRRGKRLSELDEVFEGETYEMPENVGLAGAMLRLPERARTLLLLRYYHNFSVKEIAKLMKMKEATIYKALEAAKGTLAEQLKKEEQ